MASSIGVSTLIGSFAAWVCDDSLEQDRLCSCFNHKEQEGTVKHLRASSSTTHQLSQQL
jgi:hypothetical protein